MIVVTAAVTNTCASSALLAGNAGSMGDAAAVPATTAFVPELSTVIRSMRGFDPSAAPIVKFPDETATCTPATSTVPDATATVMSGVPCADTAHPDATPVRL